MESFILRWKIVGYYIVSNKDQVYNARLIFWMYYVIIDYYSFKQDDYEQDQITVVFFFRRIDRLGQPRKKCQPRQWEPLYWLFVIYIYDKVFFIEQVTSFFALISNARSVIHWYFAISTVYMVKAISIN